VLSCPLAGCTGAPAVVVSGLFAPSHLRTDAKYVYWLDAQPSAVDGGAPVSVVMRIAK
jgi:hypothetical protein